jgi:serine/threonine-protein kinase
LVHISDTFQALLAGRYSVERELGRGGMATVLLARDLKHDRLVAIKVMQPKLSAELGTERFRREIATAARLQHPHILGVFDSGEADGRLWFTMPYVDGESLRDRLTRERRLPLAEAVRLAAVVADALAYAHRAGVVHRDVKPENILLAGRHPLLADLGLARALAAARPAADRSLATISGEGFVVGTPA